MHADGAEYLGSGTGDRANAWYALHTRYQHEKTAATALTNRGFQIFLPLY
jgi:hypothetical protein